MTSSELQPRHSKRSALQRVEDSARQLQRAKSEHHSAIRTAVHDAGCTYREVAEAAGYRSTSSVQLLAGPRDD